MLLGTKSCLPIRFIIASDLLLDHIVYFVSYHEPGSLRISRDSRGSMTIAFYLKISNVTRKYSMVNKSMHI